MKQSDTLHWHSGEAEIGKSSQASGKPFLRTLLFIVTCATGLLAASSGYRANDFDIDSAAFDAIQGEVLRINDPIVD